MLDICLGVAKHCRQPPRAVDPSLKPPNAFPARLSAQIEAIVPKCIWGQPRISNVTPFSCINVHAHILQ